MNIYNYSDIRDHNRDAAKTEIVRLNGEIKQSKDRISKCKYKIKILNDLILLEKDEINREMRYIEMSEKDIETYKGIMQ